MLYGASINTNPQVYEKIMNQLFLHIYMKNISTMNLIKLFKQLQQIKTKKIYILFSFNVNEKLF
jgi:hypothetical protein